MAKEKLFWKMCFPYTAIVLVPSLVKHATYDQALTYHHVDQNMIKLLHHHLHYL